MLRQSLFCSYLHSCQGSQMQLGDSFHSVQGTGHVTFAMYLSCSISMVHSVCERIELSVCTQNYAWVLYHACRLIDMPTSRVTSLSKIWSLLRKYSVITQ